MGILQKNVHIKLNIRPIKMNFKKILRNSLFVLALASAVSSCKTPENITYLQDIQNEEVISKAASSAAGTIRIEPFDKISILVTSKDASSAQLFNLNVMSSSLRQANSVYGSGTNLDEYQIGVNQGMATFTVTENGTIDYPILGVIKVQGMTRSELAAFIKGDIMGRGIINDPVVTVEFINTGISVLGEVNRPARYDLNVDRITILEGLALAGDLTIQGKRDNIVVVRKEGGETKTYLVDLTDSKKLLDSPAYYLKQGDVIYVEPNKQRKRQSIVNGNNVLSVSFWVSVASLLTSAAILIK